MSKIYERKNREFIKIISPVVVPEMAGFSTWLVVRSQGLENSKPKTFN